MRPRISRRRRRSCDRRSAAPPLPPAAAAPRVPPPANVRPLPPRGRVQGARRRRARPCRAVRNARHDARPARGPPGGGPRKAGPTGGGSPRAVAGRGRPAGYRSDNSGPEVGPGPRVCRVHSGPGPRGSRQGAGRRRPAIAGDSPPPRRAAGPGARPPGQTGPRPQDVQSESRRGLRPRSCGRRPASRPAGPANRQPAAGSAALNVGLECWNGPGSQRPGRAEPTVFVSFQAC